LNYKTVWTGFGQRFSGVQSFVKDEKMWF